MVALVSNQDLILDDSISGLIGARLETDLYRLADLEAELAAFDGFGQSQFLNTGLPFTQAGGIGAPSAENAEFVFIQTQRLAAVPRLGRRMRPCQTVFAPAAIMNQSWFEYCKMNPCGRPLGGAGKGAARRTAAIHAVSRAGSPLLW